MKGGSALRCIEVGILAPQTGSGLIPHSDRGSRCASAQYRQLLRNFKMVRSMSRQGPVDIDTWSSHTISSERTRRRYWYRNSRVAPFQTFRTLPSVCASFSNRACSGHLVFLRHLTLPYRVRVECVRSNRSIHTKNGKATDRNSAGRRDYPGRSKKFYLEWVNAL